jgi:hypothetical protein
MPHPKAQGKFFRRAKNFSATDKTRMKIKQQHGAEEFSILGTYRFTAIHF